MKISVVIPSFNDTRIIRTVKSILIQDFLRDDFEIIIVDGGSQKKDFQDCLKFLHENADIVISEKDRGIFDGLNKGINIAQGELIFMIGSDDYLIDTNAFNLAYSNYKKNIDLIIFELFYVDKNNSIERYWNLPKMKKIPQHFQIPHFSTFVSKKLIGNTRFNLDAYISADFSFFKELIQKDFKSVIINYPICCMTSGGQSSKNLINILKGNLQSLKVFNYNFYHILRFIFHKIHRKIIHYNLLFFYKNKQSFYQDKIKMILKEID